MSLKRRLDNHCQQFIYALRTISLPHWLNNTAVKTGLFAVAALFSLLYLLQTSVLATGGYQTRDLERQIDALNTEIHKQEITIAEDSAMRSIHRRLAKTNLTEALNIYFLSADSAAVALK